MLRLALELVGLALVALQSVLVLKPGKFVRELHIFAGEQGVLLRSGIVLASDISVGDVLLHVRLPRLGRRLRRALGRGVSHRPLKGPDGLGQLLGAVPVHLTVHGPRDRGATRAASLQGLCHVGILCGCRLSLLRILLVCTGPLPVVIQERVPPHRGGAAKVRREGLARGSSKQLPCQNEGQRGCQGVAGRGRHGLPRSRATVAATHPASPLLHWRLKA
mmetsp:Transcript_104421/g.265021  ORF Transcript_104421/g.265021 Transcript_104421/m.265021 type:complete len:219 (+) Transcript_104421:290-946(+)